MKKAKKTKKIKSSIDQKPVFADPDRTRVYALSVIVFALILILVYLYIRHPLVLTDLRYKLFFFRVGMVPAINRVFSGLILFNFFKMVVYTLMSRKSKIEPNTNMGRVSAIIPAYNEEKVILKTIESILESDYKKLEIIVVDDGSKDKTSQLVKEKYGSNPTVKLITKENGGKSSALNVGIREATGEYLLLLDADTIVEKDAISRMIPHFKNDKVGAVSGNTRVGNNFNLITRCQKVEYIRDFNLIKNGMSHLNCMAVVPGALGMWRKTAVISVGGFSTRTLGEDRDITMALQRKGWKITFEPSAFARTEAPSDFKDFMKQRYRWTYSTLQCITAHLGCLFNPKRPGLGFVLMPDIVIFQIIVPLITAIGFLSNILNPNMTEFILIGISFLFALVTDYILVFLSLLITKEKLNLKDWLCIVPQKIIYGVLCTYILWKSVIIAFIGGKVGWNKVIRKGNVNK